MGQAINKRYMVVPDLGKHTKTAATAINETINPANDFRLVCVLVHFASSPADAVTVTYVSPISTAYDTVLYTATSQNFAYVPDEGLFFKSGDKIKVSAPNAGNITYGLTAIYEIL